MNAHIQYSSDVQNTSQFIFQLMNLFVPYAIVIELPVLMFFS